VFVHVIQPTASNVTITTATTGVRKRKQPKIALFGHFGAGNFGNESTLQAMLYHIRRLVPDAQVTCICTVPQVVGTDYGIAAVDMSSVIVEQWDLRNPLARLLRKTFVGIPSELYRWLKGVAMLWATDAFIIPGTGLLTDAYSLTGWGPYSTFKWSAIAKFCRCRLLFVSVGAGPIYSRAGRFFVKTALSLADFRSYRDESTPQYLRGIGFRTANDRVSPDLAFSLPESLVARGRNWERRRRVVGLGLMAYAGKYSVERPTSAVYTAYLETLVGFARWLLANEYDIRLLIGDRVDIPVTQEFKSLLNQRSVPYGEGGVVDEPAESADDLLKQIASTDLVVATRFHNVLLALLLNKPSIAISFHHKSSSLMSQMGLSEYCHDINHINTDKLIEQFCDLDRKGDRLKPLIKDKAEEFRRALDEQYNCIFKEMWSQPEDVPI
jgi:polysaccharide pyruvyl transferase WcaK-like protein